MTYPITPAPGIHNNSINIQALEEAARQELITLVQIFETFANQLILMVVNAILKAFGLNSFVGPIDAVITELTSLFENFPGSVITGFTAIEQEIVDNIANALGIPGLGHDVSVILTALENIPAAVIHGVTSTEQQIIDQIIQIFNLLAGINNPISSLLGTAQNALAGLLPGIFGNNDGTASPVIPGITGNSDGTATFLAGSNPIQTLVDWADGTAMSVSSAIQNITNFSGTGTFATQSVTQMLARTGMPTTQHLGDSLSGLLPAAIDALDGTANATISGAQQIVQNLDGTATYIASQASTAVNSLIDNIDGTAMSLANSVQGVINSAQQAGSNLLSGVTGWWGSIFGAFGGHSTPVAATPVQAFAALQGQQAATASNTANIGGVAGLSVASVNQALRRSAVSSGGSGGLFATVNFSNYSNQSTLSGIFTPTSSVLHENSLSSVTQIGVTSGQATWQSLGTFGIDVELYPTSSTSDYQIVSMQLSALNSMYFEQDTAFLIGRSNSTATTCVYIDFTTNTPGNFVYLRCSVAGTITLLTSATHTPVAGAVYELVLGDEATSNPYSITLLCNGATLLSTIDSGHISQLGSTYRQAGFALDHTTGAHSPPSLSSWGLADNAPPTVIGSGFRAYATANHAIAGAGGLPASTWDVTHYDTSDLTYSSGAVTIGVSGHYVFTARMSTNNGTIGMLHNGTLIAMGITSSGSDFAGAGVSSFLTTPIYCVAGDTLQPYINIAATLVGNAAGTATYWAVTLANCGTLS